MWDSRPPDAWENRQQPFGVAEKVRRVMRRGKEARPVDGMVIPAAGEQDCDVPPHVLFGVDRLCGDLSYLGGARRVGLATNDAARLARDVSRRSRVAMLDAGVPIVRLFGPEHGLGAAAADGASVLDSTDSLTGLPVISLYGERLRPTRESLGDLDAVLFDIPDIGTRFYTYIWTLYHLMAACADAAVPLIVLDRPNPLGGDLTRAEGPLLEPACRSFIGEDTIPVRHQLTLGELARLWQRERFPLASLHIVLCSEWRRSMSWPDTGLPWVPTSPAMPTFESAQVYPGTCVFEATNLSIGRGTDAPFQLVGAPWLDSGLVLRELARLVPGGVACRAVQFTPATPPHANVVCQGIHVSNPDPAVLGIVAFGLLLLAAIVRTHAEHFRWNTYPTAANPSGAGHFERLLGRRDIRGAYDVAPLSIDVERVRAWTTTADWSARVRDVLCYDA
ncbi:MAG: DUF1343 domain-containing protein [Gemmatimonas sp.]